MPTGSVKTIVSPHALTHDDPLTCWPFFDPLRKRPYVDPHCTVSSLRHPSALSRQWLAFLIRDIVRLAITCSLSRMGDRSGSHSGCRPVDEGKGMVAKVGFRRAGSENAVRKLNGVTRRIGEHSNSQ